MKDAAGTFFRLARWKFRMLDTYAAPLALLWARLFMGNIFWKSGRPKLEDMDAAKLLFETDFIPNWTKNSSNIFGLDLSWTVPDAGIASQLATAAEIFFPVLLALGLAARAGAFALLCMTLTIELFIYPGTAEHYYWMTILVLLVAVGPGKISLDHVIRKKCLKE